MTFRYREEMPSLLEFSINYVWRCALFRRVLQNNDAVALINFPD